MVYQLKVKKHHNWEKTPLGIKGAVGILDIPSSSCVFILSAKSSGGGSYGEDIISHMKNEFTFPGRKLGFRIRIVKKISLCVVEVSMRKGRGDLMSTTLSYYIPLTKWGLLWP